MVRWGIDLTLVWVLGVLPVWLVGVVDMHSSRLIALRPVTPTSSGVVAVLNERFLEHGRPVAVMTDDGGQFIAATFRDALRLAGVRHNRIRRVFRTVKELQRFYAPVLVSLDHVRSFCADVLEYYNHCRPHSSHWELTPDEVDSGRPWQPVLCRRALGQLQAFLFT